MVAVILREETRYAMSTDEYETEMGPKLNLIGYCILMVPFAFMIIPSLPVICQELKIEPKMIFKNAKKDFEELFLLYKNYG